MTSGADIDVLCADARRAFRSGNYPEAVRLFQQVLSIDADHADALDALGKTFFLTKDYEHAIESFERLSRLKPREGKPCVNLGAVYNRLGQHSKAVEVLRRGIQRDPRSSEGYYNLGIACRHLDDLQMAVNAYRECIRLNPEMAEAHHNLANVYLEMGNHRKAIDHYNKALEIKPGFARAEKGLQKAEQACQEAKEKSRPFGRLVDEKEYAAQQAGGGSADRELTEVERRADRQTVRTLCHEISATGSVFLQHLKTEMLTIVTAISRDMLHGGDRSSATVADYERFQDAVKRFRQERADLATKTATLRKHQDQMTGQTQ